MVEDIYFRNKVKVVFDRTTLKFYRPIKVFNIEYDSFVIELWDLNWCDYS